MINTEDDIEFIRKWVNNTENKTEMLKPLILVDNENNENNGNIVTFIEELSNYFGEKYCELNFKYDMKKIRNFFNPSMIKTIGKNIVYIDLRNNEADLSRITKEFCDRNQNTFYDGVINNIYFELISQVFRVNSLDNFTKDDRIWHHIKVIKFYNN